MFELDEKQIKLFLATIHFSMPQGKIDELNYDNPLELKHINTT